MISPCTGQKKTEKNKRATLKDSDDEGEYPRLECQGLLGCGCSKTCGLRFPFVPQTSWMKGPRPP